MKKLLYLACSLILTLTGCIKEFSGDYVVWDVNEPVFMAFDDFKEMVKVTDAPQLIGEQGKICFYNGYLYLSEPQKGIHVIDNRNPAAPQNIAFIELKGNVDLAIRNNTLYADAYTNLAWFDISNPAKPVFKDMLEDVFRYSYPPTCNELGIDYAMCSGPQATKGVVVGWKIGTRKEKVEHYGDGDFMQDMAANTGSSTGVNGSMSRFSLYKDYLYVVNRSQMDILNLAGEKPEVAVQNIYVDWDVETIFSYKDCMFLGTPRGMSIYSVANPLVPERQSTIAHVFGCDPVVVDKDIAYVTVHSGNFCGQNVNELMIIDVKDVKAPMPIATYTMKCPKGLGIDNGLLFLCDDGLQIFRTDNPQTIMANRIVHYPGVDGYDVIPHNRVAMMISDKGLYQYDYSDLNNIKPLSQLSIRR